MLYDKSTPNGETAVLLLEDQDLDPLTGIDISNWPKNADALWIVPEHHRADVLKQCHDSLVAGHWGRDRTRELILRNFVWENWQEDVNNYVATCTKCQRAKADRHSRMSKLHPMPTGTCPFQEIAMDF